MNYLPGGCCDIGDGKRARRTGTLDLGIQRRHFLRLPQTLNTAYVCSLWAYTAALAFDDHVSADPVISWACEAPCT